MPLATVAISQEDVDKDKVEPEVTGVASTKGSEAVCRGKPLEVGLTTVIGAVELAVKIVFVDVEEASSIRETVWQREQALVL